MRKLSKYINFLFEPRFGNSLIGDLNLHLKKRNVGGKTSFLGKKIEYTDAANFIASRREIFRDRTYELQLDKNDSSDLEIIDCGSNLGLSIIYFKRLNPQFRITAFEPDPKNYRLLLTNLQSFGYRDIDLHQSAIWIHNEGISFHSKGDMSSSISSEKTKNKIVVPTFRLRDLLEERKSIFLLKMDIEGAENQVIPDCDEFLHKCQYIFIEYHHCQDSPQNLDLILKILAKNGFKYIIQEANAPKVAYTYDWTESMHFQLNIFATKK